MKKITFKWFNGILLPFFLLPLLPSFAQCLPSIGNAANFTIFSGIGAISNVSNSNIIGNIGTQSGTITGFETSTVSGVFHIADATTSAAATDVSNAYTAFQNLTPTITSHPAAFGAGETIIPGIYGITTAGSIAGTLILDGQNNPSAKFIFKFGGAFTSGANSNLHLINGAQPNQIYWIIEGAFSLAADCTFKGTIISNGAISIGVGNELNCKLLAVSGAISTYGTTLSNEGISNTDAMYYADSDLDGYGDVLTSSCYLLSGYVVNSTDCDDSNPSIHPGAVEIYGNEIDDDCNGTTDSDTSVCEATTTWNGSGWSNGLPSYAKEVVFESNFTTSSTLYACKIHTQNNAVVIANHDVFVFGSITIDSGSSYSQRNNTNLIQIDPLAVNVGVISVKRNTSTIVRLDHTLWSSPVVGQNIYSFSPETLPYRIYTYDSGSDTFLSSTLTNTSVFTPAKGYAVRAPNNQSATVPAEWTGEFLGVPNNGDASYILSYSPTNRYNLVGNPYPSTIDASRFITENSTTIEGTLYFYEHTLSMNSSGIFPTGTNYASWNATGATAATEVAVNDPAYHTPAALPNGSIQVGQGFFVKAKNNGVTHFSNTQRINDQNHQFLRTTPSDEHHIWLNLLSNGTRDINQLLIGYVAGATQNYDPNYDGKTFLNTGSHLYSVIDNDSYVIQGRSLPFDATDVVQLGWFCETAGNYTIKLSHWDGIFSENQDVFIHDQLTGTTTNIKTTPYNFTSAPGTFNDRFSVVYLDNLATTTPKMNRDTVLIYQSQGEFHLSTSGIFMKDVFVYDVMGRLLNQYCDLHTSEMILSENRQTKQILLIKIVSQDLQTYTVKILK
jgi:Ice-binding-like/Putative metal-binding motif